MKLVTWSSCAAGFAAVAWIVVTGLTENEMPNHEHLCIAIEGVHLTTDPTVSNTIYITFIRGSMERKDNDALTLQVRDERGWATTNFTFRHHNDIENELLDKGVSRLPDKSISTFR